MVPFLRAVAQRCLISSILDSQELLRAFVVLALHINWLRSLDFWRKYIREGVERFNASLAILRRKHPIVSLPFADLLLGHVWFQILELWWDLIAITIRVLAPSPHTRGSSIFYLMDILFDTIILLGLDTVLYSLLYHFLLV